MWSMLVTVFWLICFMVIISLVIAIFQIRKSVQENEEQLSGVIKVLEEIRDRLPETKDTN